jgi:glycosyltransferase involved in cell wall biosynthesis
MSDTATQSATGQPLLSIIIPAYNEAARLPATLETLDRFCAQQSEGVEVIVVDDGSTDDTVAWLTQWAQTHPNTVLISLPQNRGKGHAVRAGVLEATGQYLLVMDADGAAAITEFPRLWAVMAAEPIPIVIGSRALKSRETVVKGHWHRKLLGRCFTTLLFALVPGIRDTQCGFKLFERGTAQHLFTLQTLDGYAYDVEILHAARLNGYPVREVPINWTNVAGSKVNVMTDSVKMGWDLVRIGWQSLQGHYRRPLLSPTP